MSDDRKVGEALRGIAACDGRAIKITGGAGTGKSRALAHRVASLLLGGASPKSISVFVSTRAGVRDFRARLLGLVPDSAAVRITTLRDYCLELLATPEAQAATGRYPRVLADFEYKILLEDLKVTGIKPKRIREILKFFFREWSVLGDDKDDFIVGEEERLLYTTLLQHLRERKAMLCEEVTAVAFHALNKSGTLRSAVASAHIFADDYQNLNKASQALLDVLASESLTVAGDKNELVELREPYPCVEGFCDFAQTHAGAYEFLLTQSVRCPQSIAAAGNALILGSNMEQVTLVALEGGSPQGHISVVKWASSKEEAAGIAQYLKTRLQDADGHLTPQDVFIVVPNKVWGKALDKALRSEGIKTTALISRHALSGDPRTYERSRSLMLYTLLNLAADPTDLVAWRNWCGYGDYLTRSNAWFRLEESAQRSGTPLLAALAALAHEAANGAKPPFAGADELAQRYREGIALIQAHADKNGFALLNALTPRGEEVPKEMLKLLEPVKGSETAAEFYATAARRLFEPEFQDDAACVRIGLPEATVGLSVPLVIIAGAVNGFIPSAQTIDSFDDSRSNGEWQADRRLFYSTFTKAEQELIISYFQKEPMESAEPLGMEIHRIRVENGERKAILSPSAFLEEMGDCLPGAASSL